MKFVLMYENGNKKIFEPVKNNKECIKKVKEYYQLKGKKFLRTG